MSAWSHRCFWVAWLVTLAAFLVGCSPKEIIDWPELRGRVYDKATDKPMENAFVVANWRASWAGTMGGGSSGCIHAEVVRTDAAGNYVISAWLNHAETNRLQDQQVHLEVYVPQYKREGAIFTLDEPVVMNFAMEEGGSLSRERLRELEGLSLGVNCSPPDESERSRAYQAVVSVKKAIFREICVLPSLQGREAEREDVATRLLFTILSREFDEGYAREHYKKGCAYELQ